MLMRGMVIYFIMSMFRRGPAANNDVAEGGAPKVQHGAASNLYQNGTLMVGKRPLLSDMRDI